MTEIAIPEPTALSELQTAMYTSLHLPFTNIALLSTIEKATGQQRAVIVTLEEDDDTVLMRPLAMLLDREGDLDRFYAGEEMINDDAIDGHLPL
jgi:hypothetical protein